MGLALASPRGATAIGRLSLRPGDASSAPLDRLPAHLGRDALVDAGAALMAALDGGSPRWRAAAVVLRGTDAAGRPQGLALRELAAAAPDAVTAMWATLRCEPKPGCMPLAAEHWVRVDGGNLAPLLFAVADAPPSLDVLQSLATADRFSVRETALSRTVLEAMPATVPAYLQPSLWNHAIGVEAAMALPSFKAAFDGCAEPLRPGMPAYAPCTAISRTLTERSDGIMGARLGLRLSERVGLPLAESRQQRASLDALLVPPRLAVNAQQPLSCDSIAAHRRWVEQRANLGELGALRAQAAQAAAGSAPTR